MVAPKYLPHVQRMIATPGIYFLHDPKHPDKMVPIFSNAGELFAMQVDHQLDPHGFYPGNDVEGPIQCRANRGTHITTSAWRDLAKQTIRDLLSDLPAKRDWLNPTLEMRLKDLVS